MKEHEHPITQLQLMAEEQKWQHTSPSPFEIDLIISHDEENSYTLRFEYNPKEDLLKYQMVFCMVDLGSSAHQMYDCAQLSNELNKMVDSGQWFWDHGLDHGGHTTLIYKDYFSMNQEDPELAQDAREYLNILIAQSGVVHMMYKRHIDAFLFGVSSDQRLMIRSTRLRQELEMVFNETIPDTLQ